jgi:hypothetical protein
MYVKNIWLLRKYNVMTFELQILPSNVSKKKLVTVIYSVVSIEELLHRLEDWQWGSGYA